MPMPGGRIPGGGPCPGGPPYMPGGGPPMPGGPGGPGIPPMGGPIMPGGGPPMWPGGPPPIGGLIRPAMGNAGPPRPPMPGACSLAMLSAIFFSNISSVSCCSNCRKYARTFALCLKPALCCLRTDGCMAFAAVSGCRQEVEASNATKPCYRLPYTILWVHHKRNCGTACVNRVHIHVQPIKHCLCSTLPSTAILGQCSI